MVAVVIVVILILYGPLYWVIRAAVRDGNLAADAERLKRAAETAHAEQP